MRTGGLGFENSDAGGARGNAPSGGKRLRWIILFAVFAVLFYYRAEFVGLVAKSPTQPAIGGSAAPTSESQVILEMAKFLESKQGGAVLAKTANAGSATSGAPSGQAPALPWDDYVRSRGFTDADQFLDSLLPSGGPVESSIKHLLVLNRLGSITDDQAPGYVDQSIAALRSDPSRSVTAIQNALSRLPQTLPHERAYLLQLAGRVAAPAFDETPGLPEQVRELLGQEWKQSGAEPLPEDQPVGSFPPLIAFQSYLELERDPDARKEALAKFLDTHRDPRMRLALGIASATSGAHDSATGASDQNNAMREPATNEVLAPVAPPADPAAPSSPFNEP